MTLIVTAIPTLFCHSDASPNCHSDESIVLMKIRIIPLVLNQVQNDG